MNGKILSLFGHAPLCPKGDDYFKFTADFFFLTELENRAVLILRKTGEKKRKRVQQKLKTIPESNLICNTFFAKDGDMEFF